MTWHPEPAAHVHYWYWCVKLKAVAQDDSQACVDFNTKYRCRNFDGVRQSALVHQAPDQVPQDFCKPPRSSDDVFEAMP